MAFRIVGRNPVNMTVLIPQAFGPMRPCSLIVPSGTESVLGPRRHTNPSIIMNESLMDQVTTVRKGNSCAEMLGKCFAVGPRHACMTLHQTLPSVKGEAEGQVVSSIEVVGRGATKNRKLKLPTARPAADADDKTKDIAILELEAEAESFPTFLKPESPDPGRTLFAPVTVPTEPVLPYLIEPLMEAWTDQGLKDLPNKKQQILRFFEQLGDPGSSHTVKGEVITEADGLFAVRIPLWPTQSGGFLTHDEGNPTTFCGVMCCSGTFDGESNFNAAISANNSVLKEALAAIGQPQ